MNELTNERTNNLSTSQIPCVFQIERRVIDNTIGQAFDVRAVDLNLDGTLDLLVTNNALRDASLFAYTVPRDFR